MDRHHDGGIEAVISDRRSWYPGSYEVTCLKEQDNRDQADQRNVSEDQGIDRLLTQLCVASH